MMQPKQLLYNACLQLQWSWEPAQLIIQQIDNLAPEDITFLISRIQWAIEQVKHEKDLSMSHEMLQKVRSQELEQILTNNKTTQHLLDQLL